MGENGKPLIQSFAMNGGDGPNSYTKNSAYQRGVVDAAKEMIDGAILEKLDLKSFCLGNIFRIADLGCSIGPNTFIAVQNIIDAIEQKYKAENQTHNLNLELQVFFNDTVENDFNTLFKSLPPSRQYFAAGVPGSFYDHLFPKSSIHLAHLSFALHWLSELPKEVVDTKSPAWNKGSIQCTGYVKEVADAYASQFKNDMRTFLDARADEIVPGGFLIILAAALPDGVLMSQTVMGMHHDLLASCLYDMAKLGLIEEDKVDSFNLSSYFPHVSELKELIDENEYFKNEKMEILNNPWSFELQTVETVFSQIRAVMEGIINDHFGNMINMDNLFENFCHKLVKFQAQKVEVFGSATMAMAFKMATTGMWVTDECKNSFMEMKWKKVHRYIVFKIDEKSRLVTVDKVGGAGESYDDLTASLPEDDCRYAVFDFDFVTVDNCRKSKIFFIAWSPTASRIRAKILYATSKDGLRRVLDGIHYEVQATDPTEMGIDVIKDRAK